MASKIPEENYPVQVVHSGVAGYKTRAETGEKDPKVAAEESSAPLFGGTIDGATPIEMPVDVPAEAI